MINKIYKIINSRFSSFFKFIFFFRYFFVIIFVAFAFFILIPNFFDFNKKEKLIRSYLIKNFGLEINTLGDIEFKSLPLPRIEISKVNSNFYADDIKIKSEKLVIYPKLLSIYNLEKFEANKVRLEDSDLPINFTNINLFIKKTLKLNKKFNFKNLNVKIKDKATSIVDLRKINFKNFGYKQNIITGQIFNKKFKINLKKNYRRIDFRLLNTGIHFTINLNQKNSTSNTKGNFKGNILNSNLKFNYDFNERVVKFENLSFRHKNLSFDSKGLITIKPYLLFDTEIELKNIGIIIIENLDIVKLLNSKNLIKKINSKNKIIFKRNKFSGHFIDNFYINSNLAYGRLNLSKNFVLGESNFICLNEINLLDEYPVLNFNCSLKTENIKKLLKKLGVGNKIKSKRLALYVEGNLNILNKKINFGSISNNNNYKASSEDLIFFKDTFETILFDENLLNIFQLDKIKKFVQEIS